MSLSSFLLYMRIQFALSRISICLKIRMTNACILYDDDDDDDDDLAKYIYQWLFSTVCMFSILSCKFMLFGFIFVC